MLKIKLSPIGKKHDRQYRIIVMEEKSKITSNGVATIGTYNPKSQEVKCDAEAVKTWMKNGAQPTAKVRELLKLT